MPTLPAHRDRLLALVRGSSWLMAVLRAARDVDPPDWWIGGGVLRDLVWGSRYDAFAPGRVRDVDLAFFDPDDWSVERERAVEAELRGRAPDVPWEARNQAGVHTWYPDRFGIEVEPLASTVDGIGTWPETATAVAVRLDAEDRIHVTSPCGLDDLMSGILRRNPRRITEAEFRARLARKRIAQRWPAVRIVTSVDSPVDPDEPGAADE